MILLVVLAFVAIATVTVMQYREQSTKYHNARLLRKEEQVKAQIKYVLMQTTFPVQTRYIPLIFKDDIYRIANMQNINFNLYDLQGRLIKSSRIGLGVRFVNEFLPDSILYELAHSVDRRVVERKQLGDRAYQSSYSYLTDSRFKPILILNIPNFENDTFTENYLKRSLYNLSIIYFLLLILSILTAYLIAKYITKSLKTIEEKLAETKLLKKNEKIILNNPSLEIAHLVAAYNSMVDQIEESKRELTKNEREQAWREMAKQIAHEIKNPLTPMRLTIQQFERKFNPTGENAQAQITEFSETLIQHIDTLSNIATAFSHLTSMPEQNYEYTDINIIIQRAVNIFNRSYILFHANPKEILTLLDKDQINQVITNLVKNALQATENTPRPLIEISSVVQNKQIVISVKDNGCGIPKHLQSQIFEPKFTTKTTGSGLGLAIIKSIIHSYKGSIELFSEEGKGAKFVITLPL